MLAHSTSPPSTLHKGLIAVALELDESRVMKAELGSKRSWPLLTATPPHVCRLSTSKQAKWAQSYMHHFHTTTHWALLTCQFRVLLFKELSIYSEQCGHLEFSFPGWKEGCHMYFVVLLADVPLQGSFCFMLFFIYHINTGGQNKSNTWHSIHQPCRTYAHHSKYSI